MLDGGIIDIRGAADFGAEHAETGECDGEGKSADVGTSCGHGFSFCAGAARSPSILGIACALPVRRMRRTLLRGRCPLTVDPGKAIVGCWRRVHNWLSELQVLY